MTRRLYTTGRSQIEGNGCFATRAIGAGECVDRWEGEIVSNSHLAGIEAAGLYHSSAAIGEDRNLLFNVIDPHTTAGRLSLGSGTGGFNHSCDPNLWMQDAVTVVARREIDAGEELTLDYALATGTASWRLDSCNCGSELCRGTITGEDWRLTELQQRYRGHFSPFLNDRIEALAR